MLTDIFAYLDRLPRKLARMNLLLMLTVVVLIAFGVLFIYSAGQQTGGRMAGYWTRQLMWVGLGFGLMVFIMGFDYELLGRMSLLIFLGSIVLLVTVILIGDEINGAKSWIRLPGGVNLQPSELAKLATIIALAWYASFPSTDLRHYRHVAAVIAVTLVPMALIMLQPDMGSALVFVPICGAILFVGGIRLRLIAYAAVVVLLAGPMVYKFGFRPHQKQRVLTYLKPILPEHAYEVAYAFSTIGEKNAKNKTAVVIDDWNALQSELAVGSGGLRGKGFGKGTQNTLGFLPRRVAPTDFIFSVIAEETGFVGASALIGAFALLCSLSLYVAARARDDFGKYLACGIAALFCVHIFINVGMTIRVMPIIGIPLPLVSYGGSVMVLMLGCIGVLQSIYIHRQPE